MLALFEKKDDLVKILSEAAEPQQNDKSGAVGKPNGVQIYIGKENLVKIMDNSTLIFKTVRRHGNPVGAIGIIGPTRMDYKRVIAMIDRLTSGVSDMLNEDASQS